MSISLWCLEVEAAGQIRRINMFDVISMPVVSLGAVHTARSIVIVVRSPETTHQTAHSDRIRASI